MNRPEFFIIHRATNKYVQSIQCKPCHEPDACHLDYYATFTLSIKQARNFQSEAAARAWFHNQNGLLPSEPTPPPMCHRDLLNPADFGIIQVTFGNTVNL